MKNYNSPLAAKVDAVNSANAELNRIVPLLREVIKPFYGQKVYTAQGEMTAKLKKAIAQIAIGEGFSTYWPHEGCIVVKTSRVHAGIAHYAEAYSYIFTKSFDGLCAPVQREFSPYKTDYSEEKIKETKEKLEKAQKVVSDLESEISPFSRYY